MAAGEGGRRAARARGLAYLVGLGILTCIRFGSTLATISFGPKRSLIWIIAVCMLLMLTTLQRDLGYGPVEYLTVVNIHSFISMLVHSLVVLFST